MRRDDLLVAWVKELDLNRKWTWLDVGAGRGQVSRELLAPLFKECAYDCYDVVPRHPEVKAFDGRRLPTADPVDFVLFNFVLHHTRENLRPLVIQAMSLTDTLLVQEDVRDGTPETDAKMRRHDPQGVFLSQGEWVSLFREYWSECQVMAIPHATQAVDIQEFGYDVPRCLFVVTKAARGDTARSSA